MKIKIVGLLLLFIAGSVFSQTDSKFDTYLAAEQALLPVEGDLLYNAANLGLYNYGGGSGAVKRVVDTDDALPFGKAFQLTVSGPGNNAWEPQLQSPGNQIDVYNEDVLLYIFYIRVLESSAEDLNGKGHFYVQKSTNPWTGLGSQNLTILPQWQRIYVPAVATEDYGVGEMNATLHLGYYAQKIEIGGIIALNLGPGIDLHDLPSTPIIYEGMSADAPWRAEAAARIDQHRKGDISVRVINQNGAPIQNAAVDIEMTNHAYGFGNFISSMVLQDNNDADNYRDEMCTLFNCATTPFYMGNSGWGWYHSDAARTQYQDMADWLEGEDMPAKGHVLIWPSWDWMPSFFEDMKDNPAQLEAALVEHLEDVVPVGVSEGLYEWDVVNEPHINHDVMDILGNEVMIDWYNKVRELDPSSKLILNEYNIISAGGMQAFQDDMERYIDLLQVGGAPLGGIGFQCHFDNNLTGIPRVLSILDHFAEHGLPIQITEFDVHILDEEVQAQYLHDFYTAVFSHPATEKIVMWGFWETTMWKPDGALIRPDWSYKPNYYAYADLVLKDWWTDVSLSSTRDGMAETRGFLGDYEIEVTADGKTVKELATLTSDGLSLEIQLPTTYTNVGSAGAPESFGMLQNYPNPFNGFTQITFTTKQAGDVHLAVYDVRGVQVMEEQVEVQKGVQQTHNLHFETLSSGVYYCCAEFPGGSQMIRKMMYIK